MVTIPRLLFAVLLVFVCLAAWVSWSFLPPAAFPTNQIVEIAPGLSLREIAALLKQHRLISSELFFFAATKVRSAERGIQAGWYEFERPLSALGVAERLESGRFAAAPVKLTLAEGLNADQIAAAIAAAFPELDRSALRRLAAAEQGYLFPDTYFLPPHASAAMIIAALRRNFETRTVDIAKAAQAAGRSWPDVVTMASIIEEEAARPTDRRMIAAILWKRLEAGQRLEVDVATSTYEILGLPPAPIVNPGLEAIQAALEPIPSSYWFYLSDKDGIIHYAKDYEEHKRNIARFY